MNKQYNLNRLFVIGSFFLLHFQVLPQVINSNSNQSPMTNLDGFESFQATVSLNFKNAKLVDILRLLAIQHELNIISAEDVTGEVSVSLTDVNLGAALDAILKVNDYDWFLQDNIIVVKKTSKELVGELTTRIYKLNYVDASAVATALTNVLTPKGKVQVFSPVMKGGLFGGGGQTSLGGGGGSGGGLLGGSIGGQGSQRGIAGQRGSMDHILVTDYFSNFPNIDKIISQLDKQIPQINIAVKFIETTLSAQERLGINWSMRSSLTLTQTSNILKDISWKTMRMATLTPPIFSALMEILSSDGSSRLLQEPQVTVKDNMMANITVGTTIPILVPQPEGGLAGTSPFTFQNEEINITLSVLPRINEGKYISMDVQADVRALIGYTTQGERPIISTRTANTSVMVRDGETLLMGGLIFDQIIETNTKFPLLSKIPLIKLLFKHKSVDIEQRELLLFITPNIIILP